MAAYFFTTTLLTYERNMVLRYKVPFCIKSFTPDRPELQLHECAFPWVQQHSGGLFTSVTSLVLNSAESDRKRLYCLRQSVGKYNS